MGTRIAVAGATGSVGSQVVALAKREGHWVRALSKTGSTFPARENGPDEWFTADALKPGSLKGFAEDVGVVISCLGASVRLSARNRRAYSEVDVKANVSLIEEAERSGVKRFVYVAAHSADGYRDTAYCKAHEVIVERLQRSRLESTTVRPTGLFPAFDDLVQMARRGRIPLIGDGSARTNPVHPGEVAGICVQSICEGPREVSLGGPEILTRKEIAGLAFTAVGKTPRYLNVSPGFFRQAGKVTRVFHPRVGELLEFVSEVATHDAIAPKVGKLQILNHFKQVAQP